MIHIACGANAAYMPYAAAMLRSLLTQTHQSPLCIHFMYTDALPLSDMERLRALVTDLGGNWQALRINPEQLHFFPPNSRFGIEAWYRTLLPELLPDLPRVLYLDADTLVLQPLDELWATDLQDNIVGAIRNPLYPFMNNQFQKDLGLRRGQYFNSGVLLMDLQRWRGEGISRKLQGFVKTHAPTQNWPDQNALNAILRGRWLQLSPRWNAHSIYFDLKASQLSLTDEALQCLRSAPGIVHFVAPYKPLDFLCKHPYRKEFFRHLARTPWSGTPVQDKTLINHILRVLPQPFMWVFLKVTLPRAWQRLRKLAP